MFNRVSLSSVRFQTAQPWVAVPPRFGKLDLENPTITPRVLFEDARQLVIGQDHALRDVSVFLAEHIMNALKMVAQETVQKTSEVETEEVRYQHHESPPVPEDLVQSAIAQWMDIPEPTSEATRKLIAVIARNLKGHNLENPTSTALITFQGFLADGEKKGLFWLQPERLVMELVKDVAGDKVDKFAVELPKKDALVAAKAPEVFNFLARKMAVAIHESWPEGQEHFKPRKDESPVPKSQPASQIEDERDIRKATILLVGETGVGKTQTLRAEKRAMQKHGIQLPFLKVDATEVTESGYVGKKPADIARAMYHYAGKNLSMARRGILFLDELDKKRKSGDGQERDIAGEGAQNGLLTLMEDGVIEFSEDGTTMQMPTSGWLNICAGAFVGLADIVKRRLGKKGMGFGAELGENVDKMTEAELLTHTKVEDLEAFGLKKELIGRLAAVIPLRKLTPEDLRSILEEAKDSPVLDVKNRMALFGIDLEFDGAALDIIAEYAYNTNTGGRALAKMVHDVTLDLRFEAPDMKGEDKKVRITAEYAFEKLRRKNPDLPIPEQFKGKRA